MQSDVERVASAHAPSDGADAIFLHVGLRREKVEGGVKIAFGAVFGNAAHDFVSHVGSSRDFAAIEIDGERDVSLVSEFRSLIFHPVVQSPPFVDDDQRGERAFSCGRVKNTLHGFVAAFVGDGLAVGSEGGGGEQNDEWRAREVFSWRVPLRNVPADILSEVACGITTAVPCRGRRRMGFAR